MLKKSGALICSARITLNSVETSRVCFSNPVASSSPGLAEGFFTAITVESPICAATSSVARLAACVLSRLLEQLGAQIAVEIDADEAAEEVEVEFLASRDPVNFLGVLDPSLKEIAEGRGGVERLSGEFRRQRSGSRSPCSPCP